MRTSLVAIGLVAIALGAVLGVGAVTSGDAVTSGVYLNPAQSDNGQAYASVDESGELTIEATDLNAHATTVIDDVFTISATEYPTTVWIEHAASGDVTFYRMDTRNSIESAGDAVELQPGENVTVGMQVESESSSTILDGITVRAEVEDGNTSDGGGDTGGDSSPDVDVDEPEPLRVIVETDGDEQTVTIENAREGQSVSAGLNETATMRSAGVHLRSMDLALGCDGDAQLRVLAQQETTRVTPVGTDPLFAYSVNSSGDCGVSSASTYLAVDRGRLDDRDRDPTSVTSLRMPTADSDWEETTTRLAETTDDHYVYETRTNGFSEFALVADVPVFTTDSLTTNRTTVRPGEPVQIDGIVRNVGRANGTESVNITVDGEVVAGRDATLEPNETASVTATQRLTAPGAHTIVVGDREVSVTVVEQNETATPTPSETPTETATPTATPDEPFQIGGLSASALLAIAFALAVMVAGLLLFRRQRDQEHRE